MSNVCFINGSLRGKKASSLVLMRDVDRLLDDANHIKTFVSVKAGIRGNYPEDTLKSIADADAIVMVFPLHNYGLPGALMRLLEDYYRFMSMNTSLKKEARVYAIVNCGFARPEINAEAFRVINNFCRRLSAKWRFGIAIGGGPVVVLTKKVPIFYSELRQAYREMALDIEKPNDQSRENYFIKPVIPERILIAIKNYYEKRGQLIQKEAGGR